MANNFQGYQSQQFFPQPQGNVYLINNSFEVANIPVGTGVSVAICMNEEVVYLKTIQNGNPMVMAYKLTAYIPEKAPQSSEIVNVLNSLSDRLTQIENQLKKSSGGKINELV